MEARAVGPSTNLFPSIRRAALADGVPALQREPLARERPRDQLIEHLTLPLEDGLAGRIKGEVARLAGILVQVEHLFALEVSLTNRSSSSSSRPSCSSRSAMQSS